MKKNNKEGLSASTYADRIGMNAKTVINYINAANTYKYLKDHFLPGEKVMDETNSGCKKLKFGGS